MHKRTFVKSGKIYASEKRKFTMPEDLLKTAVKNDFVKEKNRSIKINTL